MKMLRAAIVVVVGLVGSTVLTPPLPVQACDCALRSEQEVFSAADAVFTGTVTVRFEPTTGPRDGSSDPIAWTIAVDNIAKGTVTDPQTVISAASEASCGFEFTIGKPYQVYAQRVGTTLETDLCSGTRAVGGASPAVPLPTGLPVTGQGAESATVIEPGQHDGGARRGAGCHDACPQCDGWCARQLAA
jgi:hypothetical protein